MAVVTTHGLFNYIIQDAQGAPTLSYESNALVDFEFENMAIQFQPSPLPGFLVFLLLSTSSNDVAYGGAIS